jgi:hypothetical protein
MKNGMVSALGLVILFVVGILAGGVGGLLGIGGCVLMMPVIRFGFHFSPTLAVGTTLTAVVFTAAAGAYKHWRLGNVDWGAIKYIAPAGVLGVIIGSIIFYFISGYGEVIDLIVGLAFVPAAIRMLYEGVFQRKMPEVAGDKIKGSNSTKAGLCFGPQFHLYYPLAAKDCHRLIHGCFRLVCPCRCCYQDLPGIY